MFFSVGNLSRAELGKWDNPAPVDSGSAAPASRPDLKGFYGEYACAAMADEIEAGNLRALIVFGGNPLAALPDSDRIRRALGSLEVLVVMDSFDTAIGQLATHALPAAWQLERSDIRERSTLAQYAPALVPSMGESRPGWWLFGAIAEQLNFDIFHDGLSLAERSEDGYYRQTLTHSRTSFDEFRAAGTAGVPAPRLDGWFHKAVLGDRGWRIAPKPMLARLASLTERSQTEALLVSGRVDFATNSMLFPSAVRREHVPPAIHVSTDIAAAKGLAGGDRLRISTAAGQVEGMAQIDSDLTKGTVWMNHGWLSQNINQLFDSQGVDPLTIQPNFSAIPVAVEKV